MYNHLIVTGHINVLRLARKIWGNRREILLQNIIFNLG